MRLASPAWNIDFHRLTFTVYVLVHPHFPKIPGRGKASVFFVVVVFSFISEDTVILTNKLTSNSVTDLLYKLVSMFIQAYTTKDSKTNLPSAAKMYSSIAIFPCNLNLECFVRSVFILFG